MNNDKNKGAYPGTGWIFPETERTCKYCGNTFFASRSKAFCSDDCSFWGKVDKRGPDDCWPWLAYKLPSGHGIFGYSKTRSVASRYALASVVGPLREGQQACHKCDNPPCVNPAHLFVGAQSDNIQDCVKKNRQYWVKRTHCVNGHEFTAENTATRKARPTTRVCLTCKRESYHRLAKPVVRLGSHDAAIAALLDKPGKIG